MTAAIESGQSHGTVEVTPSGIPVYYQSKPKRLYRIRNPFESMCDADLDWEAIHKQLLHSAQDEDDKRWREVPSVTTALGVLEKKALPWWGQGVGIEGALALVESGHLYVGGSPETSYVYHASDSLRATKETVAALLTEHKLTVNHVRDKAGDRGQSVHDAFEAWARTGLKPDAKIYPDEERGYVEGLLAFLTDVPTIEPIAAEVLVASAEHGFAGRYDIRFRTWEPHDVVVHRTPVRGATYRRLAPGLYLGDLKSSKSAYLAHALQLSGYEGAGIESGYEPTEGRGILLVSPDGNYQFKRSSADFSDFLAVLDVHNRLERGKKEWL